VYIGSENTGEKGGKTFCEERESPAKSKLVLTGKKSCKKKVSNRGVAARRGTPEKKK